MPAPCPRLFHQLLVFAAAAAVLAAMTAIWHPNAPSPPWSQHAKDEPGTISASEARSRTTRENVLWLDARSSTEFARGHVPGALRLTEEEWEVLLEPVLTTWTPERPIFVYCSAKGCSLSHGVAVRLRRELGVGEDMVWVVREGWEGLRP